MEIRKHEGRRSISVRGSSKCKGPGVSEHGCSKNCKEASGSGTEGVMGREGGDYIRKGGLGWKMVIYGDDFRF